MSQKRPLSPFMLGADYKLQTSSVMSFLHRASGVACVFILLTISCWLAALAKGPESFHKINALLTHWLFFIPLVAGAAAACYHFCNGIRHLFWDAGIGLNTPCAAKSANIVKIATAILTLLLILAAWMS